MSRQTVAADFFFVPPSPEQEIEDLRAALKHTNTRRMIRRLFSTGNVMGPSKANGDGNTEYNEGIRALALWLAGKIENAVPGGIASLMRESGEERIAWTAMHNKED